MILGFSFFPYQGRWLLDCQVPPLSEHWFVDVLWFTVSPSSTTSYPSGPDLMKGPDPGTVPSSNRPDSPTDLPKGCLPSRILFSFYVFLRVATAVHGPLFPGSVFTVLPSTSSSLASHPQELPTTQRCTIYDDFFPGLQSELPLQGRLTSSCLSPQSLWPWSSWSILWYCLR